MPNDIFGNLKLAKRDKATSKELLKCFFNPNYLSTKVKDIYF